MVGAFSVQLMQIKTTHRRSYMRSAFLDERPTLEDERCCHPSFVWCQPGSNTQYAVVRRRIDGPAIVNTARILRAGGACRGVRGSILRAAQAWRDRSRGIPADRAGLW